MDIQVVGVALEPRYVGGVGVRKVTMKGRLEIFGARLAIPRRQCKQCIGRSRVAYLTVPDSHGAV
jgi:hypothetical protein